jgi:hypothetical protein
MIDPRALRTIKRLIKSRDKWRDRAHLENNHLYRAGSIALAEAIMIVEEEFECTSSSEKASSTPLP